MWNGSDAVTVMGMLNKLRSSSNIVNLLLYFISPHRLAIYLQERSIITSPRSSIERMRELYSGISYNANRSRWKSFAVARSFVIRGKTFAIEG